MPETRSQTSLLGKQPLTVFIPEVESDEESSDLDSTIIEANISSPTNDDYTQGQMEQLLAEHRAEQESFRSSLNTMMESLTLMTRTIQARDAEIATLRERVDNFQPRQQNEEPNQEQVRVNRPTHVPYSEISGQIPVLSCNGKDDQMPLELWFRRVDSIKTIYSASDETIRAIATNKFSGQVKEWYEAQENLWESPWPELRANLTNIFSTTKDYGALMADLRSRMWNKGQERLEEYYIKKLALAKRVELDDREIVRHVLLGIRDVGLRTQLAFAMGDTETLEKLSINIKLVSKVFVDTSDGHSNRASPSTVCDFCKKTGHVASRCVTDSVL